MKVGYLDCFAGLSSSRLLGALVNAGVPEEFLHDAVDALDIGAKLELIKINRCNISTIKAQITLPNHEFDSGYYDFPTFIQAPSITGKVQLLSTIQALISNSELPEKAKELAIETFIHLARAEAHVRGLPIEEIYFHEVKALNTIVTVTLCCVACTWLEIDQWYSSPLNVGAGLLRLPQGSLPIPTPTTLELLGDNAPIFASALQKELLTSTAAALLKTLKVKFSPCPPMNIARVGYGGGRIEYDSLPNFLRIYIGSIAESKLSSHLSEVMIVEAEFVDHQISEIDYVLEQLYQYGAQTVYIVPIQTILGKQTSKLVVVCSVEQQLDEIKQFLFLNLQIEYIHWRKEYYDNVIYYEEQLSTLWGKVNIHIGQLLNNQIISITPNIKICQEIAEKHHLPYAKVVETIKALFISRKN